MIGILKNIDKSDLIDKYRRSCPTQEYYLVDSTRQFPRLLASEISIIQEYPFILELAYYEFYLKKITLDKFVISKDYVPYLSSNEVEDQVLVPYLNPAHILLQFEYPIIEIVKRMESNTIDNLTSRDFDASSFTRTELIMYRHPITYETQITVLDKLIFYFITFLRFPKSYSEIKSFKFTNTNKKLNIINMLHDLFDNHILLGSIIKDELKNF